MAQQLVLMHPAHVGAIFYRSAPGLDYTYTLASPLSWLRNAQVAAAYHHLVDTTAGRDGPDVWMLYRENYTVVTRNVNGTWKGTHGGATWKAQHVPLILSGPDIRPGIHSQFPARAIDIAPTLERLLGLPAIHRDGVILADALSDARKSELNSQQSVAPGLSADVTALQAQSTADDHNQSTWPRLPRPIFPCAVPPRNPATPRPPACGLTKQNDSDQ